MRTQYDNGYKENPADLLRRFGGRLALLDCAAEYALTIEEVNGKHGYLADPAMRTEIALGIQELYLDFEQMREAVEAYLRGMISKEDPIADGGDR